MSLSLLTRRYLISPVAFLASMSTELESSQMYADRLFDAGFYLKNLQFFRCMKERVWSQVVIGIRNPTDRFTLLPSRLWCAHAALARFWLIASAQF